jgi:hypothetical protein
MAEDVCTGRAWVSAQGDGAQVGGAYPQALQRIAEADKPPKAQGRKA